MIEKRIFSLHKERKRIKSHKGEYVDTDAWMEGVLQRSKTKELKSHLKKDHVKEVAQIEQIRSEMVALREKMFETEDKIHSSKRQADKIAKACAAFIREFRKFESVSATNLMDELNEQQGLHHAVRTVKNGMQS
jgi:chromosome segregation ATPase